MADAKAIRKNAKRELGEWFAGDIKRQVSEAYKLVRETSELRAVEAITIARLIVQKYLNKMMEANFYAGLPH